MTVEGEMDEGCDKLNSKTVGHDTRCSI